jgi:hypothetical protein
MKLLKYNPNNKLVIQRSSDHDDYTYTIKEYNSIRRKWATIIIGFTKNPEEALEKGKKWL